MDIKPTPAKEIAAIIDAKVLGDGEQLVTGFNEIHRVRKGDCCFVDHTKYYEKALGSAATTIVINKEVTVPEGKVLLVHNEPFTAFNQLTKHFNPLVLSRVSIASSAKVHSSALIMPGCFIGENVTIGANSVLHANVVVYHNCEIGENVIIHANTTIGSDAFYFKKREKNFEPLYSCGTVVIEDNVVLGSNCTIDRGVTDVTRIGKGTIMDNQVHVGHDVIIGEMCLFAAQVGIAGATTIGNKVTAWGQVGFSSGLTVGDGATVLAQSGVGENIPPGATYFGTPAGEAKQKMKELFAGKQLPELIKKLYEK
jgi:UDP-3-O-[3-hydroxymyristoyl] glucosamine N-acyltransferase